MKLLLIRHGESVGNSEGRVQGQLDSPLSDRGRDQSRALARRLVGEGWPVAAIYGSDLRRAAETAEILAAELQAPLRLDERLREYDIGVLTGLVWREIESLYPEIWRGMQTSPVWTAIPEEEGTDAFHARLAAVMAELRARHMGDEVVAVVAHGGSLGVIVAHLIGIDTRLPVPFRFGNASLSLVEFRPRGPVVTCLNDTCHLDGSLR